MDVKPTALISLDQLKSLMGPKAAQTTEQDEQLTALINSVTDESERRTGRHLASATYSMVRRDGSGLPQLFGLEYPITAISGVFVDNVPQTVWHPDLMPAADPQNYHVVVRGPEASELWRWAEWPIGIQNVLITSYTAGYTECPEDLLSALVETCVFNLRQLSRSGIQSRTHATVSVSFFGGAGSGGGLVIPERAASIFESYMRDIEFSDVYPRKGRGAAYQPFPRTG